MRANSKVLALSAVAGILFGIVPGQSVGAKSRQTVLYTFHNTGDGAAPVTGVTMDARGNLYGTTYSGNKVFKLTQSKTGYGFKVIQTAAGFPPSSLVFDTAGNLYGTTQNGGSGGCGSVFKLSPRKGGTWTQTMIHSFSGQQSDGDGCNPYSSLTFDSAGNLFGSTLKGGGGNVGGTFCYNGCGSVFELSPNKNGSWSERVIHGFTGETGSTDGQNPYGAVAFDSKGNLWGTTQAGGTGGTACNPFGAPPGCGTVFELSPTKSGKWKEVLIYSFQDSSTGWYPYAGPVIDAQDNVYGPLVNGGPGNGAVFRLVPDGSGGADESLIYSFAPCDEIKGCRDGVYPFGGLNFDSAGNLYGTTFLGGGASFNCNAGGTRPTGCGTVFKLTNDGAGNWSEKILYRFLGSTDGVEPEPDRLVIDRKGNLFGSAPNGGDPDCSSAGCGVIFEVKQ